MRIIKELPPYIENKYVAIDTEWAGLNQDKLHRPHGNFVALSICYEPDTVFFISDEKDVREALSRIEKCVWLMHKADFDINYLRMLTPIRPRENLIDTLLIERILWSGYYDRFGLADLARRYLDIFIDKSMRKKIMPSSLTGELEKYAAMDADTQYKIWMEQKKYLTKQDFIIYKEIDLACQWAIMDFMGFRIDVDKWISLAEENKRRQQKIDEALPFNPRSPRRVLEWFNKHGIKLKSSGVEDLIKALKKYEDTKEGEVIKLLLESRALGTRASRYGKEMLEKYLEDEDGYKVIHCSYSTIGASTGRMSSNNPNMQNIPKEKSFRECFAPRENHVLLIADYSAQEPRITAHLSQDEKLIELFNNGEDIYCAIARTVFNRKVEKGDPLRQQMKAIILGLTYGMSSRRLAEKLEVKEEEAKALIDKLFKQFPQLSFWLSQQKKKRKVVTTASGRKIWLNPYSNDVERVAVNWPIQGTAADMTKKALATIWKEWKFDCPFACVGVVHDEVIFDVPKPLSYQIGAFIKEIMEQTGREMCPSVSFVVDIKECNSWADKE